MDEGRRQAAAELVAREAHLLDTQQWDAWLALYDEDAVLWVPTWRGEHELVEDPQRELSFIHLQGRERLAERVFRVTSGRSTASVPLPRTSHLVTGSLVEPDGDGALVRSAWMCHVWRLQDASLVTYTGRYEHRLAWRDGGWRIHRKTIVLVNDRLESQVDFYCL